MRTARPPPPKSASAPATRISCRCCCSAATSSRSASAATGRSMRRREEVGLPVGVHAFGFGGNPITASGWPSFYIEEMVGHSQCQQTALASLVLEGVFERYPETQDGDDRGRLRLGAVAVVAARQEFRAAAQRGAASQAPAVGIYPRPHLVDHAADGRPGTARPSVRSDRLDRLGQAAVRDRLSALGF